MQKFLLFFLSVIVVLGGCSATTPTPVSVPVEPQPASATETIPPLPLPNEPTSQTQKKKIIQQQLAPENPAVIQQTSSTKTEPPTDETKPTETNTSTSLQPAANAEPLADPHLAQTYISSTLKIEDTAYEISVLFTSTAYDQLVSASVAGKIKFYSKNYGSLGNMVEEINGIKNSARDSMYWIYYINGKKAHIGASNYFIHAGDVISWKYEDEE